MTWSKKMSRTDAQQKTKGYPVPYLRLTKARNPQNNQSWFRKCFFKALPWVSGFHGEHQVEECEIPFDVTIEGVAKGVRIMRVTHDDNRQNNNNTPNTWIHYDPSTIAELKATDCTGLRVTVDQSGSGVYRFTVA